MLMVVLVTVSLLSFAAEKKTITVWWQTEAGNESAVQTIIGNFNRTHPYVQVEVQMHGTLQSGAGLDMVKVAIAGGAAPHLIFTGTHLLTSFYADNLIIPMDEVLPRSYLETIEYVKPAKEMVTSGNRILGVQFRTDARGLYMNQDMLAEVGLNIRQGPRYTADLDEYAAKLTVWSHDRTVERAGFVTNGNNFLRELGWLWVFGGAPYDPVAQRLTLTDHPAHLAAVRWIEASADRYGTTAQSNLNNFINRKTAMMVESTTRLEQIPLNAPDLSFWVSHIPYPEGMGRRTTYSAGPGLMVPTGTKDLEAVIEFIKYIADKETQKTWYKLTRQPPARFDALMELIQERVITDPREVAMLEVIPEGFSAPPFFSDVVMTEFGRNLQQLRQKRITAAQVLENTQRVSAPYFEEMFAR
ncbi:MAG TPA: extracellular solute-binding protein [Firmicutes bacterium]|nr:extracellular solute-binding protein [Bacillota bacterium]